MSEDCVRQREVSVLNDVSPIVIFICKNSSKVTIFLHIKSVVGFAPYKWKPTYVWFLHIARLYCFVNLGP